MHACEPARGRRWRLPDGGGRHRPCARRPRCTAQGAQAVHCFHFFALVVHAKALVVLGSRRLHPSDLASQREGHRQILNTLNIFLLLMLLRPAIRPFQRTSGSPWCTTRSARTCSTTPSSGPATGSCTSASRTSGTGSSSCCSFRIASAANHERRREGSGEETWPTLTAKFWTAYTAT